MAKTKTDQILGEENVQQAIMQIMQSESQKAQFFVPHMLSLGMLRERILQRVIVESLPRKLSVNTGLITHEEYDPEEQKRIRRFSRQIDILIHDHFNHAPLYQLDDFVVCSLSAAKCGIEVKSRLKEKDFLDMVGVNVSIRGLSIHNYHCDGFGYAMKGPSFSKFIDYYKAVFDSKDFNSHAFATFPIAVVCQDQNYVCVRPCLTHKTKAKHFVFYAKAKHESFPRLKGWASAVFIELLSLYGTRSQPSNHGEPIHPYIIYDWHARLPDSEFEKYYLDVNGIKKGSPIMDTQFNS